MNIGIIGLPQTGKKTLFGLLAGERALHEHADPRQVHRGVAEFQDPRFDKLVEIYQPQKRTRARLELVLLPKIEENVVQRGDIFNDMGEVDALCHVVRVFASESVYHIWGEPDPIREIEFVQSELLLNDLLFVEKRLERLESDLRKMKDETRQRESELLLRFKEHLEAERPLRQIEISRGDRGLISSYPFLTLQRVIVVLNVSEDQVDEGTVLRDIRDRFAGRDLSFAQIAVSAESDIAQLENEDERLEFMKEMGIREKALHVVSAEFVHAVGLVSFFTTERNELRQWFVRGGARAPEAAGKIHGDMERGFIRAEIVHYDDLVECGSEEAARAAGKYHVKGKEYEIRDGDVVRILFNV
jgi:GTP-binding protein YchF